MSELSNYSKCLHLLMFSIIQWLIIGYVIESQWIERIAIWSPIETIGMGATKDGSVTFKAKICI